MSPLQKLKLKREPDLTLKHEAFTYQLEAVNAVKDLEYSAIFHEQGLGKTKVAIDLIVHWLTHRELDTALVVAKKGLVDNWQRELAAHSQLMPRVLTNSRSGNFYVFNSPARVMLAHYEAVKAERERMQLFLRTRNVGVILDESTKIKNPDAALTKTFLDLGPLFTRRVIMSGTPVSNRPQDIWSQIKFLDGGESLGDDFGEFKRSVNLSNDLSGAGRRQQALELQLERIFHSIFGIRRKGDQGERRDKSSRKGRSHSGDRMGTPAVGHVQTGKGVPAGHRYPGRGTHG